MASLSGFFSFRSAAGPAPRPLVARSLLARARPASTARRAAAQLSARSSNVAAAGASSREPTPLQRALAAVGVADWAAYDTPHFSAWASRADPAQLAAKAAELSREGLAAADVERLLQQPASPLPCDLETVFCPNLAYLRALLAGVPNVPKRREPAGLTVLGRLLRDQPFAMARLVSQTPTRLDELDRWVCDELGVEREELAGAAAKSPNILWLSAQSGRIVAGFLSVEWGLSQQEIVGMLLRRPVIFSFEPSSLRAKLEKLKTILGKPHSVVVRLVVKVPAILMSALSELPGVLLEIDRLWGRPGAGVKLVLLSPVLATTTVKRVLASLNALRGLGLDDDRIRAEVDSYPSLLTLDLEGPDQQQKLAWAAEQGLSLSEFFASSAFEHSMRKMASRHAFMHHLNLGDCIALSTMTKSGGPTFLHSLSRCAGRKATAAEFEAFVAGWLDTDEGRRWGLKPEKRRPPPKPRGRAQGKA